MLMLHAKCSRQVIVDACFAVEAVLGIADQPPASVALELWIIVFGVCNPFIVVLDLVLVLLVFPDMLLVV